jgi:putative nucleotidyltransferase with HDIG domain
MTENISFYKKNKGPILRVSLLILSIVIVVLIFPGTRKFRYEFQKGRPWQHDNLIAPFNFSIYKLDKELLDEKDSLKKIIKPYFQFYEDIEATKLSELTKKFEKEWIIYFTEDSISRVEDANYRFLNPKLHKEIFLKEFDKLYIYFKDIYKHGIVDPSEILEYVDNEDFSIVIQRNGIAEIAVYGEFFTLKTAYEYVSEQLAYDFKNDVDSKVYQFLQNIEYDSYISANLIYNKDITEKVKQSELNDISLTMGFVQAGERIVYKGEVVDDDKFRILMSLKKEYEKSVGLTSNIALVLLGKILVILSSFICLFVFIFTLKKEIIQKTSLTLFILLLVVLFISIASIVVQYDITNLYLVPFALSPVIVKVFFDSRLALFVHLITIFTVGFIAPNGFEFIIIQFVAGFASIFSLTNLTKRGQMYKSALSVFLAMSFLYFGIAMTQEGDLSKIEWIKFAYFAGNAIILLTAYPLIYAFEKLFGFISDVTLLELSDTNHILLRKLAQRAPGTFQHSMQVANLCEQAAYKIGANPQLVRTGALYHDIGKMTSPLYFIENQISGINPHDNLEFDKSAEIIISHVANGIEIAQKNKIPPQIIDFIKTHHGTSKVQFFYRSYVKKYPEKDIDVNKFTYFGPKPFSKETAILMMADSVEAAARSLKVYNDDAINNLVDKIIEYQYEEKQFTNADITFKDISSIKKLFKEMLRNIYHARIEYPK